MTGREGGIAKGQTPVEPVLRQGGVGAREGSESTGMFRRQMEGWSHNHLNALENDYGGEFRSCTFNQNKTR